MLEPYVLKGTRTVPRRGEMSNHLFLFDKTPNKQVAQNNKSRNPRLLQSRGSSNDTHNIYHHEIEIASHSCHTGNNSFPGHGREQHDGRGQSHPVHIR